MGRRSLRSILAHPETDQEVALADEHIRRACAEIQAGWTPQEEYWHRVGVGELRLRLVLCDGRLFRRVEYGERLEAAGDQEGGR
jgi:hypothetical protein